MRTWVLGPAEQDHEQRNEYRDPLADEFQTQLQPPIDALRQRGTA